MGIFVDGNVDYTPLLWWWLALNLIVPALIYRWVRSSARREALKRVRPMIEALLNEECSTLTVDGYIRLVEHRFGRKAWLKIHAKHHLPSLPMVEDKEVELV